MFAKNRFSLKPNFKFFILVPEGSRKKKDTSKCSQRPHLYTTYEATYDLKSTGNEIFAKTDLQKDASFYAFSLNFSGR